MAKEDRGFASMDRNRQRDIASKGGKAAHQKGTAHEVDERGSAARPDARAEWRVIAAGTNSSRRGDIEAVASGSDLENRQ